LDRYSRTIAFLKVLLPLTALAILATLFLLSRSEDTVATIPFAEDDVSSRTRDQQVTRPFFSGTTSKGEEILVTADSARPGNETKPGDADNLNARLKLAGGQLITLRSDSGTLSAGGDFVTFMGNVRIESSTGMVVLTEQMNTSLNGIQGHAPGLVNATGPLGDLTAGSMEFYAKSGDGDVHMLFKNGVKLVYDPKQMER
jgi:lipopolysaccharide export system protein LptC